MPKPRLILLGKLPPPYIGPAIATEVLLTSSLRDDFQIHHFNTKLNESVASMGRFGWRKLMDSFRGAKRLYREARQFNGDVALVPISQTTVGFIKDSLYILALKRAGVPTLVQLRGSNFKTWFDGSNGFVRWWVRFILARTFGVVVLGQKLKSIFADFFPDDRIFVCPNGADFPELRGIPNPPSEKLEVLYLSNFLPGKGFDVVLEAVVSSTELKNNMTLQAYGAWDDEAFREKCEKLISDGNLTNVQLNPPVSGPDKWEAFNKAQVFVFVPRHPEGHPWAIVEAMAAALPVVSTDRGAITESVQDGENGFIVESGNPYELAEKLAHFCNNPESRVEMGTRSRALYEAQFTADQMASRYTRIFNQVIERCAE